MRPFIPLISLMAALLAGCAQTTVTLEPATQAPLCDPTATALVLWSPRWRADQKDAAAREQAALAGLQAFFSQSGCFARTDLRKAPELDSAAHLSGAFTKRLGIEVRELGPIVRLLASPALVEGGTEVALRITEYAPPPGAAVRSFSVHWRNAGAGLVKGVASLPDDMQAALRAGLQPGAR